MNFIKRRKVENSDDEKEEPYILHKNFGDPESEWKKLYRGIDYQDGDFCKLKPCEITNIIFTKTIDN